MLSGVPQLMLNERLLAFSTLGEMFCCNGCPVDRPQVVNDELRKRAVRVGDVLGRRVDRVPHRRGSRVVAPARPASRDVLGVVAEAVRNAQTPVRDLDRGRITLVVNVEYAAEA